MTVFLYNVHSPDSLNGNCSVCLCLIRSNTFEVDVSRFVPERATQLTLAQFGQDLTEDQKAWFARAELPERYRIEIVDNRTVVLKARCAPKALAVSFR